MTFWLARATANFGKPALLIGIAAIIVGLYAADQFLAGLERSEIQREAQQLARSGAESLHQGKNAEAVDRLRRAQLLVRDDREYSLQLAEALLADDQPVKAANALGDVLSAQPNDGRANLLMAKIADRQGNFVSADAYFHRAIYGAWRTNGEASRTRARLELARSLVRQGDQKALLSEVIALEAEAGSDAKTIRALPALYIKAGSPSHAKEAYRREIRERPDADAYAGLGELEWEEGNFRQAERSFREARSQDSNNPAYAKKLQLARAASQMDPTMRNLSSADKLTRSNRVLALAASAVAACTGVPVEKTNSVVNSERSTTDGGAETHLEQAERLWRDRPAKCGEGSPEGDLIEALMRKWNSSRIE